jgi:hypothetical protein
MILDSIPISSSKAWKEIAEGKTASNVPQKKRDKVEHFQERQSSHTSGARQLSVFCPLVVENKKISNHAAADKSILPCFGM